MQFLIRQRRKHSRGEIYTLSVDDEDVDVLLTTHASERIVKWSLRNEQVFETLLHPEEVLVGHRNRFIAHKRFDNHLIRVVYEYEHKSPVIVTVYFPYSNKYFQGGGAYEDKVLK